VRIAAIRPPRLRTLSEEGERTATWLELFYDLAFVAVVAVLGVRLASDTSWTGWLSYLAYFTLVWWLWTSHTFYADRFDTDDLVYRSLAALQMVAIAIIGASLSLGESASTAVFAAGFAAMRIILLVLYARVMRHVPEARELVRGYLIGFGAAAVLWITSIWVPEPARFWLWGAGFVIDLATPYVMRRAQAAVPLDASHLPERFGLFTILVLGETIVAVTVGLGDVSWQWATTLAGAFGLLLATALWWIYFDNIDGFVVRRRGEGRNWRPTVWIYSHLPLAIGLAMVGVGTEHAIVSAQVDHEYPDAERWLLVAGVALTFAAIAAISLASATHGPAVVGRRRVINRLLGAVGAILVGLLTFLNAPMTAMALLVVCLIQIIGDLAASNLRIPSDQP
jgi:low temperature requirement protein LtrA